MGTAMAVFCITWAGIGYPHFCNNSCENIWEANTQEPKHRCEFYEESLDSRKL
jgi:hypothetical protein